MTSKTTRLPSEQEIEPWYEAVCALWDDAALYQSVASESASNRRRALQRRRVAQAACGLLHVTQSQAAARSHFPPIRLGPRSLSPLLHRCQPSNGGKPSDFVGLWTPHRSFGGFCSERFRQRLHTIVVDEKRNRTSALIPVTACFWQPALKGAEGQHGGVEAVDGAGGAGRGVFRRGKTRASFGRCEPERHRRLAGNRNRPGGVPDPGLPRVACDFRRRVPGQRDDCGQRRHLPRHRAGKHARGSPRRVSGESLRQRVARDRSHAGHFQVCAARGRDQHGRESHDRSHRARRCRVRFLAAVRPGVADVVVGRCDGHPHRGAGTVALVEHPAPAMARRSLGGSARHVHRHHHRRARRLRRSQPHRRHPLSAGVPADAVFRLGRASIWRPRGGHRDPAGIRRRHVGHAPRVRAVRGGDVGTNRSCCSRRSWAPRRS